MKMQDCRIGVRIVAYGVKGRLVGTVIGTTSTYVEYKTDNGVEIHYSYPQQCRKLIKKAPEYIYIPNFQDLDNLHVVTATIYKKLSSQEIRDWKVVKFKRVK